MSPLVIIAAANAALSLVETLIPKIQEWVQTGEITADQQADLLARYNSLKNKADGQFSGPEWKLSTEA